MNLFSHEDSENHTHHIHDYCEVVKEAKVEKTNSVQKKVILPFKQIRNIDLCSTCVKSEILLSSKEFDTSQKYKNSPAYLANKIFLI